MNVTMFLYKVLNESLTIFNQILLVYILKKFEIRFSYLKILYMLIALSCVFIVSYVIKSENFFLIMCLGIQFLTFMSLVQGKERKVVYFLYTIFLETFLYAVLGMIFMIGQKNQQDIAYLLSNVVIFVVFTLISLRMKNKHKKSDVLNSALYVFLTFGLLSAINLLEIVNVLSKDLTIQTKVVLISTAIATVFIYLAVYVFYNKNYLKKIENEKELVSLEHLLKIQEQYFQDTVQSYEEIRRFRHDINGYFNTIDSLILNKQYGELETLAKNLKQEINKNDQFSCSNVYISATLNQFLSYMEEQNIHFTFAYDVFYQITMNSNHICSLIYNLMSNAIEGCKLSENEKSINLSIYASNAALSFEISNSVRNEFSLSELEQGKTSKKDKQEHGLGLKNINHIVDHYQGNMSFQEKDHMVTFYITLLNVVKQN